MNKIDGDLIVSGVLKANSMTLPANSVGNNEFTSGDPLDEDKQEHRHVITYSQKHGTATVTERKPIHVPYQAGTVLEVLIGNVVACVGDSTITVDVYKNGTSILAAPITLDNTNTAFTGQELASISTPSYGAAVVFEVVVTATVGTGTLGQGLFVRVAFAEDAA